jgi:hypothetical protein
MSDIGKAVAWRYLYSGKWFVTDEARLAKVAEEEGCEIRPLYEHSPEWIDELIRLHENCITAVVKHGKTLAAHEALMCFLRGQLGLAPERMGLDAIRQAIEERDAMEQKYHDLAEYMVYHGNSVSWWHSKAIVYRDALDAVWAELRAAGVMADGKKTCADGVRELAARLNA